MSSLSCIASGSVWSCSWRREHKLFNRVNAVSHMCEPNIPLLASVAPYYRPCIKENKADTPAFLADYYSQRIEELKKEAKQILNSADESTESMKLIDDIQRLGIAYHFSEEINVALDGINSRKYYNDDNDLFDAGLRFRLLRQHGYNVPSDVFNKFKNKKGRFRESLGMDVKGMLSLYEASYLGAPDEDVLEEARVFSRRKLETSMLNLDPSFVREVKHALKLPRQMRMVRLEARNYIEHGDENTRNPTFLELAKLDFNMVQTLHKKEMNEILRWWKELGLAENLSFARDRPLECFLWTVGMFSEPCFSKCRVELTKAIAILLVIDDVFDSYGSLDELALFTKAVERWDLDAVDQLPNYMKLCYLALYNTTNDIGYKVLKEYGGSIITYLKRTWVDLCKAFLIEAQWFNQGYVPTLEEYLTNGCTTGGTYMALVHSFFLMGPKFTEESLSILNSNPKLFSCTAMILRLWDDLGTSTVEKERGDVASCIECYMRENPNCSEKHAREHIKRLIGQTWKELNKQILEPSPLPQCLVKASVDLSRMTEIIYQHGDDPECPTVEQHIKSLLVDPISI